MKKLITLLISLAIVLPVKAATTDNISYGTSTSITINNNSQTASATACQQSTPIDNTTTKAIQDFVTVTSSTSNSAIGSTSAIYIYVGGSEDGTNFDHDNAIPAASAGAYTINAATNLKRAAIMNAGTAGTSYVVTFEVSQLFGGVMPRKWILYECNDTNQTTAASGNSASHSAITYTNQ